MPAQADRPQPGGEGSVLQVTRENSMVRTPRHKKVTLLCFRRDSRCDQTTHPGIRAEVTGRSSASAGKSWSARVMFFNTLCTCLVLSVCSMVKHWGSNQETLQRRQPSRDGISPRHREYGIGEALHNRSPRTFSHRQYSINVICHSYVMERSRNTSTASTYIYIYIYIYTHIYIYICI